MKRNTTIGAILLGAGLGILLGRLAPGLVWLWPFGLIAGGVLLWRHLGGAALAVAAASLSLALLAAGNPFDLVRPSAQGRVAAHFESSDAQEEAWRGLERVVLENAVGDIRLETDDDLELEVTYYRNRGRAEPPAELHASYDPASRTLRVVGVDPHAPERTRRGLSADLELRLPAGVRVEAATQVGSLELRGGAEADLSSDVGDIRVTGTAGEVVARTRVGSLELSFDAPVAAPISAQTEVGDVRLSLPATSDVAVRAISSLRQFGGDLEPVTGDERRLSLGAGQHRVLLQSSVGKVEVRVR